MEPLMSNLAAQTVKDFEWILVDFVRGDNEQRVSKLSAHFGIKTIHIQNVSPVLYMRDIAQNRNLALSHASGRFVVFLDDYSVIKEDFLERHLEVLAGGMALSCGNMSTMSEAVAADWYSFARLKQHLFCVLDHRYTMLFSDGVRKLAPVPASGPEWTYTGNLGIPMAAALALNGFDPRLSCRSSDCDFGLRASALGYRILYNPQAESINLFAGDIPYVMFDHDHAIERLLKNNFAKLPSHLVSDDAGYGTISCTRCGAVFMKNPAGFIYDKLKRGEYRTPEELFDLRVARTNSIFAGKAEK
jgi:glycosyltransferase involved in cell wall biosynthesis